MEADAPNDAEEAPVVAAGAADLTIPYKCELDGTIRAAMVQSLVKYLLYLRGQIPWYVPPHCP